MAMIYSFGYKLNGQDQFASTGPAAPMVLDCRSIHNPHNDRDLRRLTGRDKAVQSRMLRSSRARVLIRMAVHWLKENPAGTVAFGCAYGKHRSVALAELVAERLREQNVTVTVVHTGAASKGRYA